MTSRKRVKQEVRASLYGWVKWLPIIALPFALAVQEVHYRMQVTINDYRGADITRESRELERELEVLRVEQAQLEALDRLDGKAPDLGLVRPAPQQMRTIYIDARTREVLGMEEEPLIRQAAAPAPAPAPAAPSEPAAAPERLATMAAPPDAAGAATLDESSDHLLGVL